MMPGWPSQPMSPGYCTKPANDTQYAFIPSMKERFSVIIREIKKNRVQNEE